MFWIVFAHVGGISPGAGLGFADRDFMQYLMQTIGFFPIPAFVLVSGFLYARRPTRTTTLAADLRKVLLSIVVPALLVGAVFYLVKAIAYGQTAQMSPVAFLGSLFYPHTHLWFLYALFWTYAAVMLLDAVRLLDKPLCWLGIMIALVIFELAADLPINFLSLYKLPYMLPFFLMGYGLQRYGAVCWTPAVQRVLLAVGLFLVLFNQWTWFSGNLLEFEYFKVLERMMSWCLLPLIFLYRPAVPVLATIGPLTFVIYLFHPFAAGFARIAMYKFTAIEHPALQLSIVLVFSVVASILAFKVGLLLVQKLMRVAQRDAAPAQQLPLRRKALKTG
jgi:fucose 4-O-acetylase-like acetyltransferase